MDKIRILFTICFFSIFIVHSHQTDANAGTAAAAETSAAESRRGNGELHKHFAVQEYRSTESFTTQCSRDEVVVMVEATYERSLGNGRCNASLPDNGGCTRDIKTHLDRKCSGTSSCDLRLQELCGTWNVSCDDSGRFKFSYECVKVTSRNCQECDSDNRQAKLTMPEGYLASVITSEKNCGTAQCPWSIQVQPGQAINVVLMDFSGGSKETSTRGSRPTSDRGCVVIKERANPKEIQECAGGRQRERQIYTSVSNTLEVHLIPKESKFLVYYEATGCADVVGPRGSRMKRTGNQCEIDCPGTELKWTLTCEGNQWTGDKLGQCPGLSFAPGETEGQQHQSTSSWMPSLPTGVLIALVVAITVIIAVLVLTIGFFFLKKHQYEMKHKDATAGTISLYGVPCSEFEFCNEFGFPRTSLPPGTMRSAKPRQSSGDLVGPPNSYAADRQLDMRQYPRPLPSIPPTDGSAGSWRRTDPKQIIVQLHRTNSGAETVSFVPPYPTMMLRDGRLPCNCGTIRTLNAGACAERPPSHLYFTLDPEVKVEEPAVPVSNHSSLEQNKIGAENRTLPKAGAAIGPRLVNEGSHPMIHANSQNQIPNTVSNSPSIRKQNPTNQMNPMNQMNHADPQNQIPPMNLMNGSNLPTQMNFANIQNQTPVNRVNRAESQSRVPTNRANPAELQSLIPKSQATHAGSHSQTPMKLTDLSNPQMRVESAECDAPLNLSLGSKRNVQPTRDVSSGQEQNVR